MIQSVGGIRSNGFQCVSVNHCSLHHHHPDQDSTILEAHKPSETNANALREGFREGFTATASHEAPVAKRGARPIRSHSRRSPSYLRPESKWRTVCNRP